MPVLEAKINPSGAVSGARIIKRSLDDIGRSAVGMERTMGGAVSRLRNMMLGLFAGIQLKNLAKGFLDTAVAVQNYRRSLEAVIGDTERANKTFEELNKWAALNPVDTNDAIAAFVRLKSAAVDNTQEALKSVADLSSVMNTSMEDVARAVVSLNTIQLQGLGILLDRTGKKAIIQSGKIRVETEKTADSIRKGLIKVIEQNYAGAMARTVTDWRGAMNTMGGMYDMFKQNVMGSVGSGGPFDALLTMINKGRTGWEKWMESDSYKTLVKNAQDGFFTAADAGLAALQAVSGGIDILSNFVSSFPDTAKYGLLGRLLLGPKGALLGILGGLTSDLMKAAPDLSLEALDAEVLKRYGSVLNNENERGGGGGKGWQGDPGKGVFRSMSDGIKTLREELEKARGVPFVVEGIKSGKTKTGVDALAGALEDAGSKASELAEKLAKALGISTTEAERRLTSAREIGITTAAEIARLKERNSLLEEAQLLAAGAVSDPFAGWKHSMGFMSDETYASQLAAKLQEYAAVAQRFGTDLFQSDGWRSTIESLLPVVRNMGAELSAAFSSGKITADEYKKSIEELIDRFSSLGALGPTEIEKLRESLRETSRASDQFGNNAALWADKIASGLSEAIVQAQDLGDALRNIAKQIAGSVLHGLFLNLLGVKKPYADGAVFSAGEQLTAFARGGIVTKPTIFPMARGAGLMGEAGPEAIMPLKRTSDGSLGVRAEGGGTVINNFHINAVDARSFADLVRTNKALFESITVENIMRNGAIRGAIRGAV